GRAGGVAAVRVGEAGADEPGELHRAFLAADRQHAGRGRGPVHESRARGRRLDRDRRAGEGGRAVARAAARAVRLHRVTEPRVDVLQLAPDRAARRRGGASRPAAAVAGTDQRAQSKIRHAPVAVAVPVAVHGPSRAGLPDDARERAGRGMDARARAGGRVSADGGNATYRIALPAFEGPLDLLLHLCKTHEIDIVNIPIAFVTRKYLEYLEVMQSMSVDVAADYLVMAATVAYLKSRELVPTPEPLDTTGEDGDPELDPREELIRRLL